MPNKQAIISPHGRHGSIQLTFSQLHKESNRYASGLSRYGLQKGNRAILMVKPGPEFIALAFALFKIGAVPVLIDPGMGISNLLNCVKKVKPDSLIAVPLAHLVRIFQRQYFSSIKYFVTVGRKVCWGGAELDEIRESGMDNFPAPELKKDDPAAILFTSGSTGIPKGVLYEHGMFVAQAEQIKSYYGISESEVDMPAFPLFALSSIAMGMTCVIPDMNPSKPAKVNPKKLVSHIIKYKVTTSFGSPAIWDRVGEHCLKSRIELPNLKRILMAGAPVPGRVLNRFKTILADDADTFTPYGATESLPVASISGKERFELDGISKKGAGTCVGKPLPGITVKIIKISDTPISIFYDSLLVEPGGKGEIIVKGDVVTREYFGMPEQSALAKIQDGAGVWHRMGDVGYFDKSGRLWFCGRKDQRIVTKNQILFTIPCEAIFNEHPDVFRSALVGIGSPDNKRPIIIIEPVKGKMPLLKSSRKKFVKELLDMGEKFSHTKSISDLLFYRSFPVDIRHNVKIRREELALWARRKIIN